MYMKNRGENPARDDKNLEARICKAIYTRHLHSIHIPVLC
jgi:hypothetical protein